MIVPSATAPLTMEVPSFMITVASIDPIAMVDAKSKLDILAKVRSPAMRTKSTVME